jgi:ribosome-associated toxin RatA of RatAB toxin-antitoxin module
VRSWRVPCLALALLAAQAGGVLGAEDLAVEVERNGERYAVRAEATLAAAAALAWQVLTDYDNLPRFIPGLSKSAVLARSGDRVLLEQAGEARFLLFSYPMQTRLEVLESPQAQITSRAVAGNLKRMNGRYELQRLGSALRLRYSGEIEPDFELPPLIGTWALRAMVEEQFAAMVAEIERRAARAE